MSAEFNKAWDESRTIKGSPSNDEKLDLYAYGKIVKGGVPEQGGMFNLEAKAKYGQWKKYTDAGVTKADAETKYVELVNTLKTKYGTK